MPSVGGRHPGALWVRSECPRDGQERGDRPSGLGLSVLFCMVGSSSRVSHEGRWLLTRSGLSGLGLWGLLLCELWRWEGEWWSGEWPRGDAGIGEPPAELPARGEGGIGDGLGDECVRGDWLRGDCGKGEFPFVGLLTLASGERRGSAANGSTPDPMLRDGGDLVAVEDFPPCEAECDGGSCDGGSCARSRLSSA